MFGSSASTAVITTLCRRRGAGPELTTAALRIVQPTDKGHSPVDRALAKQFGTMARRFAQVAHRADDAAELQEMVYVVLSAYAYAAREAGDEHYTVVFEQAAFSCRVELTAERLEQVKALL